MNGKSLNITEEKLQKLKEIFPEAFTENKIDWEKLKSTFGDDINFSDERYVLNWAGKSDAFRAIQTQTTATLIPDKEESVNFDETGNLFIEGENLEVLKVLQKAYYGKIKMIYIDPPYNTGNDFIYNDKFAENKNEYLLRSGEKDEEGLLTNENLYRKNSKESGHYHSNWLTMMYPRLFLAKNLLRDDGVIFVSIDDNEVHNLRMIMNEIFGEENFVATFIWRKKRGHGRGDNLVIPQTEYILNYAKNINSLEGYEQPLSEDKLKYYKYKDEKGYYARETLEHHTPKGAYIRKTLQYPLKIDGKDIHCTTGQWLWNEERVLDEHKKDNIDIVQDTLGRWRAYKKIYLNINGERRKEVPISLIDERSITNNSATIELKEALGGGYYDFPKPSSLIKKLINFSFNDSHGIILDFFSGSGTTAHAVLDLNKEDASTDSAQVYGNRKFIMVQLPEKIDEKSEVYKAGYETIADIGKERIRRVIRKIEDEQKEKLNFGENKQDLGFKVFKLQESNFKIWRGDKFKTGEELEEQLHTFVNPVKEGSTEENILYELLLKSGIDLNCKIEKRDSYYLINENELIIALSKINEEIVKKIIKAKPQKVITLDKLFEGNDQLKTNTILQMKDAGIEFKAV